MRRLALIGFLALVSSACTIDIDLGIQLTPSGSGSVSVNVVTDDEFQSLFALTGREFEDLIATRGNELGLSFVVVPGDQPRYFAQGAEVSADTLIGILEGLAPGLGSVDIARTESALELDAQLNALTTIDDVGEIFEGTDPAQFTDDVSVTVNISMPGALDSSTADSTGPGDLTWSVPFSNQPTRLFARTVLEEEGGSFPWTLAIGAGTLVVAIVFLIAIRSGTAGSNGSAPGLRSIPSPTSLPPEQQAVGPDSRPPEEQSVAPPAEAAES